VINRDPDEWRRLVDAAEPVVAYVMRVLTTGRDLDDPKAKTEIAATVLPLIEDVAQPIERDTYRQKLARLLRVDERALVVRAGGRRAAGRPHREPAGTAPAAENESPAAPERQAAREVSKLEAYCLGALLRQPDLLYKADRELQGQGLPRLAADDFLTVEHQLIFNALTAALEQVDLEPVAYVEAEVDPSLAPRLAALLAEEMPPEAGRRDVAGPTAERTAEALIAGVLRMRKRTIANWLRELRFLAEDAREQGDVRAEQFQQEISIQAQALAGVDRALAQRGKRGDNRPVRLGLR
jgi:DNA primase